MAQYLTLAHKHLLFVFWHAMLMWELGSHVLGERCDFDHVCPCGTLVPVLPLALAPPNTRGKLSLFLPSFV